MDQSVFLDTGFAIAVLSPRDRYHQPAKRLGDTLKVNRTRVITTQAVILEIGAALARLAHRNAAIRLIDALNDDPAVEVLPLEDALFEAGYQLFKQHADKEWSLTDCLSFVTMRDRGLREALAADVNFRQAGFIPLLLEE